MKTRYYTILLGVLSLLGGLMLGFDIGAMTGSVLFIKEEFGLVNSEIGFLVGTSLLGCTFGALIAAPLSKVLGRRTLIFISTLFYFLSAFGLWASSGLNELMILRFLIGVGIGIACFATPLYIAELALKQKRGAIVSVYQLAITFGILIAFCIGIYNAAHLAWRPIFLFNACVAFLFLLFIPCLPQSPRWLYMKGFKDKALKVLQKIRPKDQVALELDEIAHHAKVATGGIWKYRVPILIGLGISVFQQITGINAVIFFAPSIIQKTDVADHQVVLMLTTAIGVVNSLATVLCIFIIDKVGRRPLLLVGISGMVVSLILLTVVKGTVLTVLSLMGFIAFFAIGLGPLFWVICSEIFPMSVRSFGMGLATLANWLCNFFVSSTFLVLTDALTFNGTFALYAFLSFISFIFVYKCVPETKGLSLEKIEDLWR